MDVQFGSMSPVVTSKPQGKWCKFISFFGHKHNKHGVCSGGSSETSSLSSQSSRSLDGVNFGSTPPRGRRDPLYTGASSSPYMHGRHFSTGNLSRSAPASLASSRESLRGPDASAILAAQKRYSDPTPAPTKASAGSNYGDAKRSFDYARSHAQSDSDRIRYFNQGVDYAKRSAALGYKDAISLLHKQYQNPLYSVDGKRELVNEHELTAFWNGVGSESAKGIPIQEQAQMQFGGARQASNNRIAAARMINLSRSMHSDHRQEFDLSHVQNLTEQLDAIIAGSRIIPSNLVSGFINKGRSGSF